MRPSACVDVARTAAPGQTPSTPDRPYGTPPEGRAAPDQAPVAARRDNIRRYQRLLQTPLTDLERQFVQRRLAEEQTALRGRVATEPADPAECAKRGDRPQSLNATRGGSAVDGVACELGTP